MTFTPAPKRKPGNNGTKSGRDDKGNLIRTPYRFRMKVVSSTRRRVEGYLDIAISHLVISRDKFCITCGTKENLSCSHLFRRGRRSLRFDYTFNCNCQCMTCNERHNSDHLPYESWFIKKYGQKKFDELYVQAWQIKKFTVRQLREIFYKVEQLNKIFMGK